eukprot:219458_1
MGLIGRRTYGGLKNLSSLYGVYDVMNMDENWHEKDYIHHLLFMDIDGAFDCLKIRIIIVILRDKMRIIGWMIVHIERILSNRWTRVKVKGVFCIWCEIDCGLTQGHVSSMTAHGRKHN